MAASLSNPSEASGDNRWHGTQVFNVNPLPPLSHKQKPNFCEVKTKATIRQQKNTFAAFLDPSRHQGRRRKPTYYSTQNSNRGLNAISRIKELRKKPYKGWMKRLKSCVQLLSIQKFRLKCFRSFPAQATFKRVSSEMRFYKFNKFSLRKTQFIASRVIACCSRIVRTQNVEDNKKMEEDQKITPSTLHARCCA